MPHRASNRLQSGFGLTGILVVALVVGLLVFAGWTVAGRSSQNISTSTDAAANASDKPTSTAPVETKSANGGFSIVFPDGWNNIIRVKNEDYFIVSGTAQPEFKAGQRAMVTDTEGYGSDSPTVFRAQIYDNFEPPQGEVTDFYFGKGADLVSGKKYVYEYDRDEAEGIGYQRLKGDRNYTYVFPLGGSNGKRELRIHYAVYGSDPRNNIERIDEMVRTIRVLK